MTTFPTVLQPLKADKRRSDDETPIDALRRAVSWLNMNNEDMLMELPTVEACLAFFSLIANDYDVSTFEEVMEQIEAGEDKPDALAAFVVRWGIEKVWTFDVETPQHRAVQKAIRAQLKLAKGSK